MRAVESIVGVTRSKMLLRGLIAPLRRDGSLLRERGRLPVVRGDGLWLLAPPLLARCERSSTPWFSFLLFVLFCFLLFEDRY